MPVIRRFVLFFVLGFLSAASASDCQTRLDAHRRWRLTRDRMPEIFAREGSKVQVARTSAQEFEKLLFRKLREEEREFAKNPTPEEAADIKEILLTMEMQFSPLFDDKVALRESFANLLAAHGLDPEEVEKERIAKYLKKGGFLKGFKIRALRL